MSEPSPSPPPPSSPPPPQQLSCVDSSHFVLKLQHNRSRYDIQMAADATVEDLRNKVLELTDIPVTMQKLTCPKGLLKDDSAPLSSFDLKPGTKILVIGSKLSDVMAIAERSTVKEEDKRPITKEPAGSFQDEPVHKKLIEKGPPEGGIPPIMGRDDPLPPGGALPCLCNKQGEKLRLTFKGSDEELWLGTHQRTQKIPFRSIRNVTSEPVRGYAGFHVLILHLGPTDASRYFAYWVPAQYVKACKDTILGPWQFF